MKYLLSIILFVFLSQSAQAVTFDRYYANEEIPKGGITLRAGTFLKVMNLRDINTFSNDIGDECEFINVADMFVGDCLVLPRNSHIFGSIEDLREPVQGNNGALKIKIDRIVTDDGDITYFTEGHVYSPADNYIGGEETAPMYYKTTPHYIDGWGGGILQLSPLNIYNYGKHTQIKAGQEVFVTIEKDLKIYRP